ncbi:unnamed protein product [Linum trigynum]|uniref:Uncharacterized protein n=1 Tax=Linum trigynum TaxID=586398 RepID=A0AAV2ES53_9ROSI
MTGNIFRISRRALTIDTVSVSNQRENLFHSRCLIAGNLLSLIVDRGSCANAVSQDMVEKLGLTTNRHPKPYKLHWLDDYGAVQVTRQAKVSFEKRVHKEELEFGVALMQVAHLLLGRPWQFDRGIFQYGGMNCYKIRHGDKKILLKPLSPKEVREDQRQMAANRRRSKAVSSGNQA